MDAVEVRKEFFNDSSMVILLATEYDDFIAASSMADIYYIEHKRNHDKEKTKVIMNKLFRLFEILDTTAEDCHNALRGDIPDYEDAIPVESAKRNEIDYNELFRNDGILISGKNIIVEMQNAVFFNYKGKRS